MGCNNSHMVKVAPNTKNIEQQDSSNQASSRATTKSLNSSHHRVIGSATSKASKHSNDSGFSGNSWIAGGVENNVDINNNNSSSPLKLSLSRASSAKERLEEGKILESLRRDGLITRSEQKCKSGLAFEVIDETVHVRRGLPSRLAKLERRKSKKKNLTSQEIHDKLQRAEQRRKEVEAERLNKISSVTIKSDIHHALDAFVLHQKEVGHLVKEKVDTAAENREKKLKEIREKLKAREEHAAKVRQRKKLNIPVPEKSEHDPLKDMQQTVSGE